MTNQRNAQRIAKLARLEAQARYGKLRGYVADDVYEQLVLGQVALVIGMQDGDKYADARAIVEAAQEQGTN